MTAPVALVVAIAVVAAAVIVLVGVVTIRNQRHAGRHRTSRSASGAVALVPTVAW